MTHSSAACRASARTARALAVAVMTRKRFVQISQSVSAETRAMAQRDFIGDQRCCAASAPPSAITLTARALLPGPADPDLGRERSLTTPSVDPNRYAVSNLPAQDVSAETLCAEFHKPLPRKSRRKTHNTVRF